MLSPKFKEQIVGTAEILGLPKKDIDFLKDMQRGIRELSGGIIIHGRSDAVLNPGGVRIGTAEIYRQVETIEVVLESIVVGQSWQDDVRVILFVVLRENALLTDAVITQIKQKIRTNTTPRHPSKAGCMQWVSISGWSSIFWTKWQRHAKREPKAVRLRPKLFFSSGDN